MINSQNTSSCSVPTQYILKSKWVRKTHNFDSSDTFQMFNFSAFSVINISKGMWWAQVLQRNVKIQKLFWASTGQWVLKLKMIWKPTEYTWNETLNTNKTSVVKDICPTQSACFAHLDRCILDLCICQLRFITNPKWKIWKKHSRVGFKLVGGGKKLYVWVSNWESMSVAKQFCMSTK